jgi:hypothetical protein
MKPTKQSQEDREILIPHRLKSLVSMAKSAKSRHKTKTKQRQSSNLSSIWEKNRRVAR